MANIENFKISSALKNLIGKELITDQYIAVFELVKNSFDAYATKVTIVFENLYDDSKEAKIIIKDNGKGMNYNDLKDKWLFLAYSAKIDKTEDISKDKKTDYRDKIQSNRIFAGAKGIGRFSCDRLGEKLNLITIKDEPRTKVENLVVSWEDFELDQTKEFIDVDVLHDTLSANPYPEIKHGTIIEITKLRDKWNRENLLLLKHSLEKLINPNQGNDTRNFSIKLIAEEEKINDKDCKEQRDKINVPIRNFVFETLGLKTTQIKTEIIKDGKIIQTELIDRGTLIYRLKERNIYQLTSNIVIRLFQLNRASKINFIRIMGLSSKKYGSIFLYKNGFRVYPFGAEGEDILKVDTRKQQGYKRYLGTRDLIGRIEINDKNNIDNLKESTSRDGGLIKNEKYDDLVSFFYTKALRRLEKYVVDLIKWGDPQKDAITQLEIRGARQPNDEDVKREIINLLTDIASNKDVIELYYDKNFLDILEERMEENLPKSLKKFEHLVEKTNDPKLLKQARKLKRLFEEHQQAKIETDKKIIKVEQELTQRKSQVRFFRSLISKDYDQVIRFLHDIGTKSDTIKNNIDNLLVELKNKKVISTKEVLNYIDEISFSNKEIYTYSQRISKQGLKKEINIIEEDLVKFIEEYLIELKKKSINKPYNFAINVETKSIFRKEFNPIDMIIVFDSLMSNAHKSKPKPKNITVTLKIEKEELVVLFKDDGGGLSDQITNAENIFEMGFTTTSGSGLGLYHVKEILADMKGRIAVNSKVEKGIDFIIRIKK